MKRCALLVLLIFLPACRLFQASHSDSVRRENSSLPANADVLPVVDNASEPAPKRPDNSSCLAWAKAADAPRLLSQTACFDAKDPRQPLSGLIPYHVALNFWSDGAEKNRWFALPNGQIIKFDAEGHAQFPRGSVLAKEFTRQGKRLETRLFVRHENGEWNGYSYEWNENESEAFLVADAGKVVESGSEIWSYPSREACVRCHSSAAGRTLGWDLLQLNRPSPEGKGLNQLIYFQKMGVLSEALPKAVTELPRFKLDAEATAEDKARAYLHVNCAVCHSPGGTGAGSLDLRFSRTLQEMKICDVEAEVDDLGLQDGRLLKPQSPEASVLVQRMARSDYSRMPPLASHRIDEEGVATISAWIRTVSSCAKP